MPADLRQVGQVVGRGVPGAGEALTVGASPLHPKSALYPGQQGEASEEEEDKAGNNATACKRNFKVATVTHGRILFVTRYGLRCG